MPCEILSAIASVEKWKPCEVIHGDRWCAGFVERWRRDDTGWRALVRYSTAPGMTYIHWRPQVEIRPTPGAVDDQKRA